MNTATARIGLLLVVFFLHSHVALAIDNPSDSVPTLIAVTEQPPRSQASALVSFSSGCLGGAALGTVLPGIGNIIGCIAGGASMWWLRRTP